MAKTATAVETVEKVITLSKDEVRRLVRRHLSVAYTLINPEEGEYDVGTRELIHDEVLEQLHNIGF